MICSTVIPFDIALLNDLVTVVCFSTEYLRASLACRSRSSRCGFHRAIRSFSVFDFVIAFAECIETVLFQQRVINRHGDCRVWCRSTVNLTETQCIACSRTIFKWLGFASGKLLHSTNSDLYYSRFRSVELKLFIQSVHQH